MEPGARGRWLAGKERSWGRSIAAEDPRISSICPVVWKEKTEICDHGKGASRTLED